MAMVGLTLEILGISIAAANAAEFGRAVAAAVAALAGDVKP